MKIEIRNRWSDAVIYTHEAEGATMRDAVLAAVRAGVSLSAADLRAANLSAADLSAANLSDANLSAANLSAANLSAADLRAANLSAADLSAANLTPVRDDIWAVLSSAPREVPAVIEALKAGRVDGSTYHGPCACLVGTIAIKREVGVDDLEGLRPNSSRPAERFFMGIRQGDTPETSQHSALALQWAQEWLDNMKAAFEPQVEA
jgi:hypothetical protein